MPLTIGQPFSQELKLSTHDAHIQAEELLTPALRAIQSYEDYARVLRMFYGFFAPLQTIIARQIHEGILPDIASRRHASLILQDLAFLPIAPQPLALCSRLPELNSVAAAFGALYVLEGSTLGGRMIAKMLKKNSAAPLHDDQLQFFHGYGAATGEKWIAFQQALNGFCDESDEVIRSARETFSLFSSWIEQTLYHESKD